MKLPVNTGEALLVIFIDQFLRAYKCLLMVLTESFEKIEALAFKHRIWPMAMNLPQLAILPEIKHKLEESFCD